MVSESPFFNSRSLKNVIFCIGDGMGFEAVKAAGYYAYGETGTLSFEAFPHRAEMATYAADSPMTDSAAAATAMATGHKVNNGVISMEFPGSGTPLKTLLEIFKAQDKWTGLVSTTYITHATPAAFAAHNPERNNLADIAHDYLHLTRPNVLLGGGGNGLTEKDAEAAGYTVVTDREGLLNLDTDTENCVSGQFGDTNIPYIFDGSDDLPQLSEMVSVALDILCGAQDGFFLLVEGGRIDHAGHSNDIERNILETIEFSKTVQTIFDGVAGRDDTLILVTADHETGGLKVHKNNGKGQVPDISWSTGGHTVSNVPLYGWGRNAERVGGIMNNTDLIKVVGLSS
jgi:alkaline phosphatase